MFTSTFDLNLSEASIVEIIDVFVDFKKKSNPAYKSLNLRGVIARRDYHAGGSRGVIARSEATWQSETDILFPSEG